MFSFLRNQIFICRNGLGCPVCLHIKHKGGKPESTFMNTLILWYIGNYIHCKTYALPLPAMLSLLVSTHLSVSHFLINFFTLSLSLSLYLLLRQFFLKNSFLYRSQLLFRFNSHLSYLHQSLEGIPLPGRGIVGKNRRTRIFFCTQVTNALPYHTTISASS